MIHALSPFDLGGQPPPVQRGSRPPAPSISFAPRSIEQLQPSSDSHCHAILPLASTAPRHYCAWILDYTHQSALANDDIQLPSLVTIGTMAGVVDPTVNGNYPIILGDGLLGKPSNDIFTGIRCEWHVGGKPPYSTDSCVTDNHKPEHSSSNAPEQARLKPAVAGKTASYERS